MKKPIQYTEAPPYPWEVRMSKGGRLLIYAGADLKPVSIIRTRKKMTRSEIAALQLIADAVNSFRERFPHTK